MDGKKEHSEVDEQSNVANLLDEKKEHVEDVYKQTCDKDEHFEKDENSQEIDENSEEKNQNGEKQSLPAVEDILSCNLCDFETELQPELDNHMRKQREDNICPQVQVCDDLKSEEQTDISETNKEHWRKEPANADQASKDMSPLVTEGEPQMCETIFTCGICGNGYENERDCLDHISGHSEPTCYKCDQCEDYFHTNGELECHTETNHEVLKNVTGNLQKCNECEFQAVNIEELNAHIQTTHLVLKVNIVKDVFIVACDHCEYKFTLNIQLKNHIRKKHPSNEKYNCRECEFASNYVADLWKHTYEEHSDQTSQFDQKEVVNMCLRMCAEQHMEVWEEM